jgi:hypothetical protein
VILRKTAALVMIAGLLAGLPASAADCVRFCANVAGLPAASHHSSLALSTHYAAHARHMHAATEQALITSQRATLLSLQAPTCVEQSRVQAFVSSSKPRVAQGQLPAIQEASAQVHRAHRTSSFELRGLSPPGGGLQSAAVPLRI